MGEYAKEKKEKKGREEEKEGDRLEKERIITSPVARSGSDSFFFLFFFFSGKRNRRMEQGDRQAGRLAGQVVGGDWLSYKKVAAE